MKICMSWVPCCEKLPRSYQSVVVGYLSGGTWHWVAGGFYSESSKCFYLSGDAAGFLDDHFELEDQPTHWADPYGDLLYE
jgi:hypothetical protein